MLPPFIIAALLLLRCSFGFSVPTNLEDAERLVRVEELPRTDESRSNERATERRYTIPESFHPEGLPAQESGDLDCHNFFVVDALFKGKCGGKCPYAAESRLKDHSCQFMCVAKAECGTWGLGLEELHLVADQSGGFCRQCFVAGCSQCEVGVDECLICLSGHYLKHGRCWNWLGPVKFVVLAFVVICFMFFVVWYIELSTRPSVNSASVQLALGHRTRTKAVKTVIVKTRRDSHPTEGRDEDDSAEIRHDTKIKRSLWPISTNASRIAIGGPGSVLFFRFQLFWIAWAILCTAACVFMTEGVFPELAQLGLRDMTTPIDLCEVVAWGSEVQRGATTIKVCVAGIIYVCTFMATIYFAVMQLRLIRTLDENTKTIKDFAVFCRGLPRLKGSEQVEQELETFLREQTGLDVVGASVCWDMGDQQTVIECRNQCDVRFQEKPQDNNDEATAVPNATGADPGETEGVTEPKIRTKRKPTIMELNNLRWKIFGVIDRLFFFLYGVPQGSQSAASGEELVAGLETTEFAWIVFRTESARDKAVLHSTNRGGFAYKGGTLRLEASSKEPQNCRWHDMAVSLSERRARTIKGTVVLFLGLFSWLLVFYVPYAVYMSTLKFDVNHQEADGLTITILSLIVVAGNVTLCAVSGILAEGFGYHFEDDKERAFLLLYFCSVVLNLILDLVMSGFVSYWVMSSSDARTWGGKTLAEIEDPIELFESFPMQKALGNQLWMLSFPATFLIPYLVEPVFLVWMPYHLMIRIVRSNPSLKGWKAETCMGFFLPVDSGRYVDVLINVTLAVMSLLVPFGWLPWFFGALLVSQIYLYLWDHYRTLRCSESFHIADASVDTAAWTLSAFPTAIAGVAAIYRGNCAVEHFFCVSGPHMSQLLLAFFVVHVITHMFAIWYLVPRLELFFEPSFQLELSEKEVMYEETANEIPVTYFSANPVHCLRSKYFYKHDPPLNWFIKGKEHLYRENPKAHQYFEDKAIIREVCEFTSLVEVVKNLPCNLSWEEKERQSVIAHTKIRSSCVLSQSVEERSRPKESVGDEGTVALEEDTQKDGVADTRGTELPPQDRPAGTKDEFSLAEGLPPKDNAVDTKDEPSLAEGLPPKDSTTQPSEAEAS